METKENFEMYILKGAGFSVVLYSGKEASKYFQDYLGNIQLIGRRADGSERLLRMK